MPQTVINRAYIFSDADLKQKAEALLGAVNRDLVKFAKRNINKDALNRFNQLINEFANASTDEQLLDLCKKTTVEKDAAANILRRLLSSIYNMVELAFEGKGHFHSFGFKGMSEMNDNELSKFTQKVCRLCRQLMGHLKPKGLSDSHLEALASLGATLEAKINACNEAAENYTVETQDRIIKGNAVYAEMMRLASVGKSIFEDEDEARYNDYVMIGSSGAKAEAPKDGKAVATTATD